MNSPSWIVIEDSNLYHSLIVSVNQLTQQVNDLKTVNEALTQTIESLLKKQTQIETHLTQLESKNETHNKNPLLLPYLQNNETRRNLNRALRNGQNVPFVAEHTKQYEEIANSTIQHKKTS